MERSDQKTAETRKIYEELLNEITIALENLRHDDVVRTPVKNL